MGLRIVKTVVAVFLAVSLAKALGLHYAMSAGLLAILGIEVTLKKSLRTVTIRILASIVGLFFASLIFYFFGWHTWTVALFLLILYPLLAKAKLHEGGVVTSCVVVFHLVDMRSIALVNIMNEIQLLLIGLGIASFINFLYTPNAERKLLYWRNRTEELFSAIFRHIADHLLDPSTVWDGAELLAAPEAIKGGEEEAVHAAENKLFQSLTSWTLYFVMRRQQLDSIQRMLDLVSQVYESLPHGEKVAQLFIGLSEDVKSEYYASNVEAGLQSLEREFKQMPLPVTREEFEMRSALLQLCRELENYLSIAKKVKKPVRSGQKTAASRAE